MFSRKDAKTAKEVAKKFGSFFASLRESISKARSQQTGGGGEIDVGNQ